MDNKNNVYTLKDALTEKIEDPTWKAIYVRPGEDGQVTLDSPAEIADRRFGADLNPSKFVISAETNIASKNLYSCIGISEEQRLLDIAKDVNNSCF